MLLTKLLRFGGNCNSFDFFCLFQFRYPVLPYIHNHFHTIHSPIIIRRGLSTWRETFLKNAYVPVRYRYGVGFWLRYTITWFINFYYYFLQNGQEVPSRTDLSPRHQEAFRTRL
jgi:hypothetical protein